MKVGQGIYTQKKRNAYKINPQTGVYGNENIDVPKLYGQLKLIAHKDGRKVFQKQVDFGTLVLLTIYVDKYWLEKMPSKMNFHKLSIPREYSEERARHYSAFYAIKSGIASDWSPFLTRAQGKCMYKVYLKNFSWQPFVCAYFK